MAPKRFIFRLQIVLNVKEKAEEEAKRKYGEAIQLLAQAQKVLVQIISMQTKNKDELRIKLKNEKGLEPAELQRHTYWGKKLEIDEKNQRNLIAELEIRVEKARLELIEAMKERKTLETLKEQQQEAWQKEMDEEEAKLIDELATLKYARDAGNKDED